MKGEKKKTIIIDVNKRANRSFRVGAGQHLTLAILATNPKTKQASYSVRLAGRGARATIVGFVVGKNDNTFALHTLQHHEAQETTSDLLVKGVLSDSAQFVYDGAIRVERSAAKTDAYQRNENLLLSQTAHAKSSPALEILANDVRCTHGATIGTLPEDQLWYLSTRGIGYSRAKGLIVEGFLISAFSKISDTMTRKEIAAKLAKVL